MRTGWYNLFVLFGTAGAWWSWVVVLTTYHPKTAGLAAFWYFFSTLFLALVGTLYLVGYFLQARIIGRQTRARCARAATRQSLLFATLLVAALFLQGQRLLSVYNGAMLILLLTFVELLFITREQRSTRVPQG